MPTNPFDDELDLFFDPDEFGTIATMSSGKTITGLFNSPFARRDIGHNQTNSQHYEFLCKATTLPTVQLKKGCVLKIDGESYKVLRFEPDGLGVVKLIIDPTKTMDALADDDFNY